MQTQMTTSAFGRHSGIVDEFHMSIDDLVALLALDNYCLVPCQD